MHVLLLISSVVFVDQMIKWTIWTYFYGVSKEILGSVFWLTPIINKELSFGGHFIPMLSNIYIVCFLNLVAVMIYITAYRYFLRLRPKKKKIGTITFVIGISGLICSLIDKIFYGGSLDYIEFNHFIVFDLKDLYIIISCVLFLGAVLRKKFMVMDYVSFLVGNSVHNQSS